MRWTLKPQPDSKTVARLANDLSIDTILAKILVQRGISTFNEAKKFFRPSLNDLHNPFLMKDMNKAIQRIEIAISNNENILIYGDYDVDGTTAVSLVFSYLKTIYKNIDTYIPDRYTEGYGISYQGIDFAYNNNFSLIIALDCGIKAVEKVAYAKTKDIDFIICDHHKPGVKIPKASAILNPKQIDCQYPYNELCGCGIGFKLIHGFAIKNNQPIECLIPYLDLVAVSIAADIVPITGENRTLAYLGLEILNTHPRNGIKAIIDQLKKKKLTIKDVVFGIAPLINAAGRIKHGCYAVKLLTAMSFETAKRFAIDIKKYNLDRKELDKKITQQALLQIENNNEQNRFTTVVYSENWHKGVIGIVASRLIETYYRPTLVFTKSESKLVGSARSVKGFDIYEALEKCSEFIEQFGGHKYAAGLTLPLKQYENFKQKFEEVVSKTIDKNLLTPEISIDSEIHLEKITPKFFRILKQLAPFGPQNMTPVFKTTSVRDNGFGKQVGIDKTHLKLNIVYGSDKKVYNAIGFGLGKKLLSIQKNFDIAYCLEENHWNGNSSIQLILKDLK